MKPISVSTANFIQYSLSQGHKINEIMQDPSGVGSRVGTKLTKSEHDEIRALANLPVNSELKSLSPPAKDYIKSVLIDGRYVLDWHLKPNEVAERLGLSINPEVVDELSGIELPDLLNPDENPVAGVKIAIISVAVAVIVAANGEIGQEEFPVLDLSKVEKL